MARYSDKQKAALENLMQDDVYTHAMKIIKSEGLAGLTMERIATEIGVSRGTLYNYFADKGTVVDFVEERTFSPLLEAIQEVAASDLDAELKLTRIANWIFTAVYEDSALIIALLPNKQGNGQCEGKLDRKRKAIQTIEGIVRHGIETGGFKKLPPVVVTEVFVGAITGMIDSMALNGEFYRADAVVPTLMELFLGGLRTV
jgi:AcrR family transcriptional regulator